MSTNSLKVSLINASYFVQDLIQFHFILDCLNFLTEFHVTSSKYNKRLFVHQLQFLFMDSFYDCIRQWH